MKVAAGESLRMWSTEGASPVGMKLSGKRTRSRDLWKAALCRGTDGANRCAVNLSGTMTEDARF